MSLACAGLLLLRSRSGTRNAHVIVKTPSENFAPGRTICFHMTENRNAPARNDLPQDDAKPDQKIGFMIAIGVAAVVLTWSWLVA